ncbi:MAG: 4a-hydroxytetrahydrobiopterin dehydratase [Sphingobacteriia bacterium]|nr:4a-hydroxytetrahydrobiopterin dehydratase [Sphingobacteriia bacterium]
MKNELEAQCIPCNIAIPPLNEEQIIELLKTIDSNWKLNEKGYLEKEFSFKNFKETMDFANKVTVIAEQEGHHPDFYITWGKCITTIWTHKINSLTKNDFILAAKIDSLTWS